jgi:hypothetical protein
MDVRDGLLSSEWQPESDVRRQPAVSISVCTNVALLLAGYSDLERAVEDLSELLEQPIENECIPVLRQKVTDKSVYVQKRNEILLEDTAKGYLEERWKWNDAVVDTL